MPGQIQSDIYVRIYTCLMQFIVCLVACILIIAITMGIIFLYMFEFDPVQFFAVVCFVFTIHILAHLSYIISLYRLSPWCRKCNPCGLGFKRVEDRNQS
jgi:membrane protein YdbS with pleckstrin-like domain